MKRQFGLYVAVFLSSFLLLISGTTREVNAYDEGITLTAAMRVGAGQIPHRDFYAVYGPLDFYALSGLFHVFGPSILVERLFDAFCYALIAALIFAVILRFCRKTTAIVATLCAMTWMSIYQVVGPIVPTVFAAALVVAMVTPALWRDLSAKRMFAAGVFTGATFLLRYDVGLAVVFCVLCYFAVGAFLLKDRLQTAARSWLLGACPYVAGLVLVSLPVVVYFRSVSSFAPFIHDIIWYPAHFYHRERNLPMPGFVRHRLFELVVYLPVGIVVVAFLALFDLGQGPFRNLRRQERSGFFVNARWKGLLFSFGLFTAIIWIKGLVRISPSHMSSSLICSMLLLAILFEYRNSTSAYLRYAILALTCLTLYDVSSSVAGRALRLHSSKLSIFQSQYSSSGGEPARDWCRISSPMTRGMCFHTDRDRTHVIEFVSQHTDPHQTIFVGNKRHDKAVINDNLIYFATQRLPATHWSDFNPGLENSLGIQREMISQLQASRPRYVILDAEYDNISEPNDSAKSSGVFLLDDYLRSAYKPVIDFGRFSILEERASP